jgi:hypothetical protein
MPQAGEVLTLFRVLYDPVFVKNWKNGFFGQCSKEVG